MSDLIAHSVAAVKPVAQALDRLGVVYYVGGSLASSTYGVSRATIDADLVADLKVDHVSRFCELLGEDYYADPDTIRDAVCRRDSFNVIYLPQMHKVDVFAVDDMYVRHTMGRIQRHRVRPADPDSEFPLASPEDIVLHKLLWFRKGGGVSERQWLDVLNVLKVQASRLDEAYLDKWAGDLGLTDLLARARAEAKI